MERLENAFNLYECGRISLERFEGLVLAEQQALARAQSMHHAIMDDCQTSVAQEVDQALAAVNWCLTWVTGQADHSEQQPLQ
ncbi:hypothetical protein GCM10011371_33250 [Novosphingobium marinum]|uniref:Uncharacterized protein n=1 Tax=Novosphingobium marinum TaxID=1514948 RepID=A0A7Y9XYM8_9SPHN|nr:hypothetical protein [Novosphingobium marinum]NYH97049.1 hypothetical protein [Novosphingobium marinum]GGC43150.1 hypothetical protein GCM10011371_33250 [Novosphingobium marinum]